MNKYVRVLMKIKFKRYLSPNFRKVKRNLESYSVGILDCYGYLLVNQKGVFDIYYYGKVIKLKNCLLSLRFRLMRLSDKSSISLFLASPYINNFFIFSGKR